MDERDEQRKIRRRLVCEEALPRPPWGAGRDEVHRTDRWRPEEALPVHGDRRLQSGSCGSTTAATTRERSICIGPSTPRLNGKVEQSHGVDAEEFNRMLDGVMIDDAQLFNKNSKTERTLQLQPTALQPKRAVSLRTPTTGTTTPAA